MRERMHGRKNAFILTSTILLSSTMVVYSLAMYSHHIAYIMDAERKNNSLIAFNMAEAGFMDALAQLKSDEIESFPLDTGYVSMDAGSFEGGYQVTIQDLGNGLYKITPMGCSPAQDASARGYEERSLIAYITKRPPIDRYSFAVFVADSLTLQDGTVIDSYDSSLGDYGGANTGTNGDVGTDAVASGSIWLLDSSAIQGDVVVGPGGNPLVVVNNESSVGISGTGTAASSSENYQLAVTSLASSGTLKVTGRQVHEMNGGTYHYSEVTISGNGQLVANGPVTMYVDGAVTIAGNGILSTDNVPNSFVIASLGSGTVTLGGNTNLYGAIYSPASVVSIDGNIQVYGGVVAKTLTLAENAQVHYDEALAEEGSIELEDIYTLGSWYEGSSSDE